MAKSYFAILGVTSGASAEEIHSAYRRLAKEYHPDHYSGGSGPFRQIQEAYSVLGNAHRRHEYEKVLSRPPMRRGARQRPVSEPEPLVPERGPADLGSISPVRSFRNFSPSYDEIFDWLWDNFSSMDWPKSGHVRDLTLEIPLTREQAMQGGTARVMVPARAVCPTCRGYGGVGSYECHRCAGEGIIEGEVPVSLSFPPGLSRDHAVMIPLDRFGIRNLRLTVLFRLTDADPW
jgi:molecular chaperone DnaJ